jgi:hypothetical protein
MWNMNRVTRIEYQSGYSYMIWFDNGVNGCVDFSEYLQLPGSIFVPLRNPDLFRRALVDGGTIAWPNGADIAPETLYLKCQESSHHAA